MTEHPSNLIKFTGGNFHLGAKERLTRLFVGEAVGRDRAYPAMKQRQATILYATEANLRLLPREEIVGPARVDPRLNDQHAVIGHNIHHRLAGRHDPADSMHR